MQPFTQYTSLQSNVDTTEHTAAGYSAFCGAHGKLPHIRLYGCILVAAPTWHSVRQECSCQAFGHLLTAAPTACTVIGCHLRTMCIHTKLVELHPPFNSNADKDRSRAALTRIDLQARGWATQGKANEEKGQRSEAH